MNTLGLPLVSVALLGALLTTDSAPREVSVSASGDLLVHTSLWEAARTKKSFNFTKQLLGLKPALDADVNLCHLETPLTKGKPRGYPVFATPIELARGVAEVGWQGCSVASNHTFDLGQMGVAVTRAGLMRNGVKASGIRISPQADKHEIHQASSGLKVAHLSYTYGTNGIPAPLGKEWLTNLIDLPTIRADAKAAKAQADIVVLSMHWGNEYQEAPSESQKRLAKRLLEDPNVDAIIGHHVHVLQPAEVINGKPVIYGHGNLWSGQGPWSGHEGGQRGVITELTFEVDDEGKVRWANGEYTPTLVDPTNWQVMPATAISTPAWLDEACLAIKKTARLYGSVLAPDPVTKAHKCQPR
jgi:poly-gamma-glutamate synthesis protein (capsule biosynthesis protein)